MKTTIVPAQITTVEDKVAGNLTFTQLLLIITPVFFNAALFVVLPPFAQLASYKLFIGGCITLFCLAAAIRVKGRLVLLWCTIILRYNRRPRYYLFNKNDVTLRPELKTAVSEDVSTKNDEATAVNIPLPLLPTSELVFAKAAAADPRTKFHYKVTKGGLRVHIQEINQENI